MNKLFKAFLLFCAFAANTNQNCLSNNLLSDGTQVQELLIDDNQIDKKTDEQQEKEQSDRQARYKKIVYILGGMALVACGIGLYFYINKLQPSAEPQVQHNIIPNQQGNPFDPIAVPPLQENENFNVGVRFYGPGYGMQHQQEAEALLMEQLRMHGNFNQAIQHLIIHYPVDPAVHIDVAFRERDGGFLQISGIEHP